MNAKMFYLITKVLCIMTLTVGMLTAGGGEVSAQDLVVGDYTLISEQRVDRFVYEYTYLADITNSGSDAQNVSVTLTSNSPHTTIVDGNLSFGDVAAGTTGTSTNTFTIRQDRRYPSDWSQFEIVVVHGSPNGIGDSGGVWSDLTHTPVPTTILLLGSGLVALVALRRKFRKS